MDASDRQLNWYLVLFGSIIHRLRALITVKTRSQAVARIANRRACLTADYLVISDSC